MELALTGAMNRSHIPPNLATASRVLRDRPGTALARYSTAQKHTNYERVPIRTRSHSNAFSIKHSPFERVLLRTLSWSIIPSWNAFLTALVFVAFGSMILLGGCRPSHLNTGTEFSPTLVRERQTSLPFDRPTAGYVVQNQRTGFDEQSLTVGRGRRRVAEQADGGLPSFHESFSHRFWLAEKEFASTRVVIRKIWIVTAAVTFIRWLHEDYTCVQKTNSTQKWGMDEISNHYLV